MPVEYDGSKGGPRAMCAQCRDVIQSKHQHDYVSCKCGAIAIDGGSNYVKCVGYLEDFIWDFDKD